MVENMKIRVKPLEWRDHPAGGQQAVGARLSLLRVHPNGDDWYLGQDHMGKGGVEAANTWFAKSILSAIEPDPDACNSFDDLVAALTEARKFIEAEYSDAQAQALEGEFLSKDARAVHTLMCAALSRAGAA